MGGGVPIFSPFLLAGWNLDILVRAGAATMDHHVEGSLAP